MAPDHPQLLSFLQAIKETPEDDTPRLILADFLADHGDEERGQFIRWQCQAARLPASNSLRKELERQADELLERHADHWLGPLEQLEPTEVKWQRGLLFLSCSARELARVADEAAGWTAAWAWVESLALDGAEWLVDLFGHPVLRQLTGLDLSNNQLEDEFVQGLARSSSLSSLRRLDLHGNEIGERGVEALADCPQLARLLSLDLTRNRLGDAAAVSLAASTHLVGLTVLGLDTTSITDTAVHFLVVSPALSKLTTLSLSGNAISVRGARELAEQCPPRLRTLRLGYTHIGDEGLRSLAASSLLALLAHLELFDAQIGDTGAIALAERPHLARLHSLDLSSNAIGDAGVRALASSPYLARLSYLGLGSNPISDAGVQALASSATLARLTYLHLADITLGEPGARALVQSPHLAKLTGLDLQSNLLSDASRQALRHRYGSAVQFGSP